MEKVGLRIKELRKNAGLTQTELALALNYADKSAIARIEKGERDLPRTKLLEFANYFEVSPLYLLGYGEEEQNITFCEKRKNKVAVLGNVQAGIPIEAIEDILGYEELSPAMIETGAEYFALRVKGDSMLPRFQEGDVVIVRKQSDVNHDDIAIVLVGNEEATIKRVVKSEVGIMLVANNPSYEPKFYSNKDIIEKPVTILGKVVELRAKF